MPTLSRVLVVLAVLAGCTAAPPPNPTPCEVSHASQACQTYMYSIAGG